MQCLLIPLEVGNFNTCLNHCCSVCGGLCEAAVPFGMCMTARSVRHRADLSNYDKYRRPLLG